MKRASAGQAEQSVEINITPMIDCVFLLLIFFIVTMKVPQIERNMPANLPKVQEGKSTTPDTEKVVRYFIRLEYDAAKDPGIKRRVREAIQSYKQADDLSRAVNSVLEREQYQQRAKELVAQVPKPSILAQGAAVRSFSDLDSQLLLLGRTATDTRIQIVLDAGRDVPFMFVIRVQEICSRRGFNEISFAAKGEE